MKHCIPLILLLLCGQVAAAQIPKGALLTGGGVAWSLEAHHDHPYSSVHRSYSLYPSAGYAFRDNQVAGIALVYEHASFKPTATYRNARNTWGAGAFYRRYAGLGKGFLLFGAVNGRYETGTLRSGILPADEYTEDWNNIHLDLSPGIAYLVGRRIQLEVSLNQLVFADYKKSRYEARQSGSYSTQEHTDFTFQLNDFSEIPLQLGFHFLLGTGRKQAANR